DDATGRWGIRVNRVELKSVEPPRTVQEAMEKQMRAERDRRAAILTAEGVKQAAVLKAEGARTAAILRAEGESKAIETVFQAIHRNTPDERLLSYQYLQMLPQLAQGPANKIFIIPSEFNQALGNLGNALGGLGGGPPPKPKERNEGADAAADAAAADARSAADAARAAEREASAATTESRLRPGMTPGAIGPGEPPAQDDPPPPQDPPGV